MDKIKQLLADDSLFYGLLIILVAVTAYGLGRHSVSEVAQLKAESQISLVREAAPAPKIETVVGAIAPTEPISTTAVEATIGKLVGSKNGTKYHLLTCPGAKQIKEENKIFFDSVDAARAAGYTPAGNCKGLE